MYVVVDERTSVIESYVGAFSREGVASQGFTHSEFRDWILTTCEEDLGAVESFLVGDVDGRTGYPDLIEAIRALRLLRLKMSNP